MSTESSGAQPTTETPSPQGTAPAAAEDTGNGSSPLADPRRFAKPVQVPDQGALACRSVVTMLVLLVIWLVVLGVIGIAQLALGTSIP